MSVDSTSLIVATCIAGIGFLLVRVNNMAKRERERDVQDIKKNAFEDVNKDNLDNLVRKLNDKVAATRRPSPPKGS